MVEGGPVEVIVVIDTSTSMMTAVEDGVRLDKVLHASARLLDSLRFPMDSGGVVAASHDVAVLRAPTSNRAALISALGGIYGRVGPGNALHRGVSAAADLPTDPLRRRLIVAVTDGGGDAVAVLAAVDRARAMGANVVGVAFGPDVNQEQADAMFGSKNALWSATAEGLFAGIDQVMRTARCGAHADFSD
jgi:hypothetical protein